MAVDKYMQSGLQHRAPYKRGLKNPFLYLSDLLFQLSEHMCINLYESNQLIRFKSQILLVQPMEKFYPILVFFLFVFL